ncbi:DUF3107 domain-containing protein [Dermatophilus congolensis]|uniref:Protein of uncharacterized function (DUF3107) n=1 Tax=Dermatophilus congolensis TaxID=1863 RepID=A0A239VQL9_9MICO|nr:DUF3107 domain-containing protein [Dermatophilus congolensis]MBO3129680.1 DUF3107 domain-containing protein [Dermatophilus congolensis]MBO3131690.1 DUF3107 domain-containing protein [Dermatophilus congolensis]MBO3134155.1 DUF3107 domain-containing protein [Dermatophilus congolensis]MBO3136388.1 DUF3107 domain-containing protein [Dermatophilus congolensis]MBO3138637.1 DUF3107 domain-containing protein [Dermatophilus congolensis]
MEVKIGVLHTTRELSVESTLSHEEVQALVDKAVSQGAPLRLEDEKGRVVVVPAATLGYVEIGSPRKGGVGFGML